MAKDYSPQQIEKALQNLPEELKEAVFSMETADAIWSACEKQEIMDERMAKIAEYAGYVLMGLMLPQEFQVFLEKEIKLPKKTAEELGREINRFVFFPVKEILAQLYKTEITTETEAAPLKTAEKPPAPATPAPAVPAAEEAAAKETAPETAPQPKKPDTYRETVE